MYQAFCFAIYADIGLFDTPRQQRVRGRSILSELQSSREWRKYGTYSRIEKGGRPLYDGTSSPQRHRRAVGHRSSCYPPSPSFSTFKLLLCGIGLLPFSLVEHAPFVAVCDYRLGHKNMGIISECPSRLVRVSFRSLQEDPGISRFSNQKSVGGHGRTNIMAVSSLALSRYEASPPRPF